jgi:hypothetical protein
MEYESMFPYRYHFGGAKTSRRLSADPAMGEYVPKKAVRG